MMGGAAATPSSPSFATCIVLPYNHNTRAVLAGLPGPGTVWFFMDTWLDAHQLAAALPPGWTAGESGQCINAEAQRLLPKLIELDRAIIGDVLDWDCSTVSERSSYACPFLLDAARLLTACRLANSGEPAVFVVEDEAFAHLLYRTLRGVGRDCSWIRPAGRPLLRRFAGRLAEGATLAVDAIRRRLGGVARSLRNRASLRRRRPPGWTPHGQADVMTVLWATAKTFPSQGHLERDPFYGDLPALIRASGMTCLWLANPYAWLAQFEDIARSAAASPEPAVLPEDFLTIGDIVWAATASLFAPVRLRVKAGATAVDGVDLAPLIRLHLWRDLARWEPSAARLFTRLARRMSERGILPPTVMLPFENQPWEKAFRLGLRRHAPATRIVGYQHSPLPELYVGIHPSARERSEKRWPDTLLAIGDRQVRRLTGLGADPAAIVSAGSFRYGPLLAEEPPERPAGRPGQANLLACTSVDLNEAVELVAKAAMATSRLTGVKLVVNFHPTVDSTFRAMVRRAAETCAGSAAIVWSDAGVRELLPVADAVLYNSSNAAFDALALGVPAIYLPPDLVLSFNKLPDALVVTCQTGEALHNTLIALRDGHLPTPDAASRRAQLTDNLGSPDIGLVLAVLAGRKS